MEYHIDAENKVLGRVASEAAVFLRGKNTPDFRREVKPVNKVKITNAAKITLTGKKTDDKRYLHHTGYPGHMKSESVGRVKEKKGAGELIRRAVYGMLPDNKLRAIMMKNLQITE